MHRILRTARAAGLTLLMVLTAGLVPEARAADDLKTGPVYVPIGGRVKVQASSKKPIKKATSPNDQVVTIQAVPGDPTAVWLNGGQQAGSARIEIVDVDDKSEYLDVVVQLDIEYLRTQLRRAVPSANVIPIPSNNNTVILTGTVAKAEDVDIIMRVAASAGGYQLVNALRVGGVQQVQLCVTVASVSRQEFRRMAANFLLNGKDYFLASTVGSAVINEPRIGIGTPLNVTSLGGQVLSGVPGVPNGAPTNLLFGVIRNSGGFIGFLEALRDESVLKLMANPQLTVLSGRQASFLVGGEQAIPVPAGLGQVGVQFEEFGTRLNFLPVVLGNGKIHLEVEPEVSFLDPANGTSINGTIVPGRTTNRVRTTVELETGQTFVIGGLIQNTVRAGAIKIPVLGDMPFVGTLFSSKFFQEIEQEVVILVTPHLVDAQACNQVAPVLPGQETRSPDDFELFLEGILEAPRGPRQVCVDKKYVPAFKHAPNYGEVPCAGGNCGANGCGVGGVDGAVGGYGGHGYAAPNGLPAPAATPLGAAPAPAGADAPKPAALPTPAATGTEGR